MSEPGGTSAVRASELLARFEEMVAALLRRYGIAPNDATLLGARGGAEMLIEQLLEARLRDPATMSDADRTMTAHLSRVVVDAFAAVLVVAAREEQTLASPEWKLVDSMPPVAPS